MHRFLVLPTDITPTEVRISGDELNHLTRVLRLGPGDEVEVFDGVGNAYLVKLTHLSAQEAAGQIIRLLDRKTEPPIQVVLVQGLPKGDKMDLIVQKCTELGVTRILPVETERVVVRLTPEKGRERQRRWQRIALEAAKQCRRDRVPVIEPITTWAQALQNLPDSVWGLLPWEEERRCGLKSLLRQTGLTPKLVYVFIGPEGGLSSSEIEAAISAGVICVSLGPRILRTETAGLAALTMILYELGDLGGWRP
ncbi:MAG: 16S rRNA (uracil(1498)-N(3))-methyltransferase [Firmicutes bacterium]|nr:16S rRNA (uracil(1498)-N(3))-methyltransferase [Bacillota bacterium]